MKEWCLLVRSVEKIKMYEQRFQLSFRFELGEKFAFCWIIPLSIRLMDGYCDEHQTKIETAKCVYRLNYKAELIWVTHKYKSSYKEGFELIHAKSKYIKLTNTLNIF